MTVDRKMQEWTESKKLEKDFFQEFQFVSGKVRCARREAMLFRLQVAFIIGSLAFVVLLVYFCG